MISCAKRSELPHNQYRSYRR